MINSAATVFFVLTLILQSCLPSQEEAARPNIIVFIADDISWNDLGCYGNSVVQTPNIDSLAAQGVRFTNAFLTTSSCSPSRISIITSRYPHNTGAAELHTEPEVDFQTLPKLLKAQGYYTAQAGKWHMGELIKSGFDTTHIGKEANGDGGEKQWIPTLRNRDQDKPFFCWFDPYDAHRTWGPNEFSGTHDPAAITPPVYLVDGDSTKADLAKYYDEITRFDHHVGAVVQELKRQGEYDNTLIVIMADNGRPFPRDKTRMYASGIQTPFIIKGPEGMVAKGKVSNSLVSVVDLAPTLLGIAGVAAAPSMQGSSFAQVLQDTDQPFRNYVFAEHNWHDYEAHERMVRSKDYLYILNSRPEFANQGPADAVTSSSFAELQAARDTGQLTAAQADIFLSPRPAEELYQLNNDSLQLQNLASAPGYAETLDRMRQTLATWMQQTGDNVPDNLTADWYDRQTGERIDSAYQIRGEMPGETTDAEQINAKSVF